MVPAKRWIGVALILRQLVECPHGHPKAAQADSQTLAPACASAFRRSRLFLPLLWEVRSVKATPRPSRWCQLSTRAGLPWVAPAGTSASVGTREGFQCPPRLGRSPETPSSILAWQARHTLVNQEEETSGLISPYMGGLPFILRLIVQAALSCRIDFLRTCSMKRRNWKCLADVAPLQVHVACGLSLKLQYRKSRWNVPGSPARPQLNPIIRFPSQTASHCTKSQEHILGCSTPIPTQSLHFPRSVTRPESSMCFLLTFLSDKQVIVPRSPASQPCVRKKPRIPMFWPFSRNLARNSLESNSAGRSIHQSPGTCCKNGWAG